MKLTKNQWYIVGVVALIVIWYFFIRKKPTTTTTTTTVPTDSVNNYTGDEDDEEDGFVSGSQIVEPIISFVIGMKEGTNDDIVINRFRRQMQGI